MLLLFLPSFCSFSDELRIFFFGKISANVGWIASFAPRRFAYPVCFCTGRDFNDNGVVVRRLHLGVRTCPKRVRAQPSPAGVVCAFFHKSVAIDISTGPVVYLLSGPGQAGHAALGGAFHSRTHVARSARPATLAPRCRVTVAAPVRKYHRNQF